MNLKERFEDYSQQPSPDVWDNVSATLRRKTFRRRAFVAVSAGVLLLSAVAVGLSLRNTSEESQLLSEYDTNLTQISRNDQPATMVAQNTPISESSDLREKVSEQNPSIVEASTSQTTNSSTSVVLHEENIATQVESPAAVSASPVVLAPKVEKNLASANVTMAKNTSESNNAPSTTKVTTSKTESATTPAPKTVPTVAEEELAFWQPNAFTPDDPYGSNTKWRLALKDGRHVKSFKIFIFSRSGRQVYKSTDYNQGWDGTANGQKQPVGAYTYVYEYYDIDLGKLQSGRGTITLLR